MKSLQKKYQRLIHCIYYVTIKLILKREKMKKYALVFVFALVAGMLSAFAPLPKVNQTSSKVAPLTAQETEGLLFMIEEENMTHDLYTAFFELYGSPSFQTIALSEQVHMDELKALLGTYNISDPSIGKSAGEFAEPALQALYDQLLVQGSASFAEALKVGAVIEEINILELQSHMIQTKQAGILEVYAELEQGSENHLRAFVRQINNQSGESYVPGHLSTEEFQRITSEANGRSSLGLQNRQSMQGKGRGMQSGQGMSGSQAMNQGFGMGQMQGYMAGGCSSSAPCANQ